MNVEVPASKPRAVSTLDSRAEQAEGRSERPLRILHVLAVSVPHLNGYTMRSKYIVDTQRQEGHDPVVVTSPFYPGNPAACEEMEIGGTHYYRVPHPADAHGPLRLRQHVCRWLCNARMNLRSFRLSEFLASLFKTASDKMQRPLRTSGGILARLAGVPFLFLRYVALGATFALRKIWCAARGTQARALDWLRQAPPLREIVGAPFRGIAFVAGKIWGGVRSMPVGTVEWLRQVPFMRTLGKSAFIRSVRRVLSPRRLARTRFIRSLRRAFSLRKLAQTRFMRSLHRAFSLRKFARTRLVRSLRKALSLRRLARTRFVRSLRKALSPRRLLKRRFVRSLRKALSPRRLLKRRFVRSLRKALSPRRLLKRRFVRSLRKALSPRRLLRRRFVRSLRKALSPRRILRSAFIRTLRRMPLNLFGTIRKEGRKLKWRCLRATSNAIRGLEDLLLTQMFEEELWAVAQHVRPDIIHAHSPYQCGVPAYRVARRMGVPMVYEVRGLWEESGVANGLFKFEGAKYRYWKRMDSEAMLSADAVVCICEQLREEVIRRGVGAERVFVVPNAVDTSVFQPIAEHREGNPGALPDEVQRLRARLRGGAVGYIGSIRKLEGVDELVRAAGEMVRRGQDVSLLIIGEGPDAEDLRTLAAEEGLGDRAVFTGRVPHDLMPFYYDLIDVFVISRPPSRVAKLVTPLKPLEAMAMGKVLVTSDLPALREIVLDGKTGVLYAPGDVSDLADKCIRLLRDEALSTRIGGAGAQWVRKERTWSTVLKQLGPAYQSAMERAASQKVHG